MSRLRTAGRHRRSQGRPTGPCPPIIFETYSHFVLWEGYPTK